ncbi:helix-turn-helix transcriptional regulator [Aerococcaceae bacterium zg-BR9]|uniref:helix-turn-helix domain-containing protein n=1 Tax=Aerococcaceae bacterium zg-1292 TaxID=2774330 RepID=UPI00406356B8|nr:helix-turn-helix transcriptional regulator [Aerococcaceae bacterium zg-BR9]MBF6978695.1 helix-turn-helix transcriptional regulator [Aerococcaceae bacterium zg-BR22]
METDKKQVGQRIKSIRLSKGMTLEEFGKLFDASKSIASRWEKGVSLPNPERLKQIAKIGDVTVDELLYGSLHNRITEMFYDELEKDDSETKSIITRYIYETTELKDFAFGFSIDENGKFNRPEKHEKLVQEALESEIKKFGEQHLNDFINKVGSYIDLSDTQSLNNALFKYISYITFNKRKSFEFELTHFRNRFVDYIPTTFILRESNKDIIDSIVNRKMEKENLSKVEALKSYCNEYYISAIDDERLELLKKLNQLKKDFHATMTYIEAFEEWPPVND